MTATTLLGRLSVVAALCCVAACGAEYPCDNPVVLLSVDSQAQCYFDPPVRISESSIITPLGGEPTLELGFYSEQLYEPLADGDDLPLGEPQTGAWVMPALRTGGLGMRAAVRCSLDTLDGDRLGRTHVAVTFNLLVDGHFEYAVLPIAIAGAHGMADVQHLVGSGVLLECTVTDKEGKFASSSVSLFFTELG